MSAPLKLTAYDLTNLGEALKSLTEITRKTGVKFTPHQAITVSVGESDHIEVDFDTDRGAYVVDDTVGG